MRVDPTGPSESSPQVHATERVSLEVALTRTPTARAEMRAALVAGDEDAFRRLGYDLWLGGNRLCEVIEKGIAPAFADLGLDVKHGRGHVVLIGFRPQWRGQPFGTFKVVFNALFYGGAVSQSAKSTPASAASAASAPASAAPASAAPVKKPN